MICNLEGVALLKWHAVNGKPDITGGRGVVRMDSRYETRLGGTVCVLESKQVAGRPVNIALIKYTYSPTVAGALLTFTPVLSSGLNSRWTLGNYGSLVPHGATKKKGGGDREPKRGPLNIQIVFKLLPLLQRYSFVSFAFTFHRSSSRVSFFFLFYLELKFRELDICFMRVHLILKNIIHVWYYVFKYMCIYGWKTLNMNLILFIRILDRNVCSFSSTHLVKYYLILLSHCNNIGNG